MKSLPFIVFICAGGIAFAMPDYALKEHKQCVYCHYDARGGGPTNGAGRYYAKHFTLEGYQEIQKKKKLKKKKPPVAAPEAQ